MQKSRSLSLQGNTVALGTWQESNQFSYLQNAKSSLSAEGEGGAWLTKREQTKVV